MSLGPAEILVIMLIALLVFGPQRLPEIGRQVGRGVREIRKFQQSLRDDLHDVMSEEGTDGSSLVEPAPTLPPLPESPAPAAQTGDVASAPELGSAVPDPAPAPSTPADGAPPADTT